MLPRQETVISNNNLFPANSFWCFNPAARPNPSSFYMYRIFNLGFNIIVFFVDMAIILLMMGAFLWLVVAYAANVSIKFGVRCGKRGGSSSSSRECMFLQTF